MRQVIAWEGYDSGDGRVISPGALRWEEPIPVRALDGRIIGSYVNVQREEDGSITAELRMLGHDWAPAIELADMTWRAKDPEQMTILNARLRGVAMVPPNVAPWRDLYSS